jgi:type III pantothenate kinase
LADLLFAYYRYPGKECIIIDAGTAITIDYLTAKENHLGGLILAGPGLQAQSLHAHTSALPVVDYRSSGTNFPGTSTEECIGLGIIYGIAGAINRCLAEFIRQSKKKPVILATGGAWNSISNLVSHKIIYEPNLTLIGTAFYLRTIR